MKPAYFISLSFLISSINIYQYIFMRNQKPFTPSGNTTNLPSEQMYRSKNNGYVNGFGGNNGNVPDRMTASIESKKKGEIINKI